LRRPNAAERHEEAADGNRNWFQSRSGLGRRRCTKHKGGALRPGGWLGLMAEAYSRSRKANWLGKKNLESRVRRHISTGRRTGHRAVQMTSERVARGAGPVQLLVGAHRGANRKRHFSATATTRQNGFVDAYAFFASQRPAVKLQTAETAHCEARAVRESFAMADSSY
jgi:hypothetical protein